MEKLGEDPFALGFYPHVLNKKFNPLWATSRAMVLVELQDAVKCVMRAEVLACCQDDYRNALIEE